MTIFFVSATIGLISLLVVKDYITEGKIAETLVAGLLAAALFYAAYASIFKWRRAISRCEDCKTFFNPRTHF